MERDEEQAATRVQLCASVNTARISITCAFWLQHEACNVLAAQNRTLLRKEGPWPHACCGSSHCAQFHGNVT